DRSPAMTCAGLLGLALERAINKNVAKVPLVQDTHVNAALTYMGWVMRGGAGPLDNPRYYFFWSLERMAVTFNLKTINGIEWYVWGAKQLVKEQNANGSWNGDFAQGGCDTCFALLFLKKVNVAPQLKDIIHGQAIEGKKKPRKDLFEF